jgi:hypothetical protein
VTLTVGDVVQYPTIPVLITDGGVNANAIFGTVSDLVAPSNDGSYSTIEGSYESHWRFDRAFGGPAPWLESAAIACATDKVNKGYYDESLVIWWSPGNGTDWAGGPGTCPVDPVQPVWRSGGTYAGQKFYHTQSSPGFYYAEIEYYAAVMPFSIDLTRWIYDPGVIDSGYAWAPTSRGGWSTSYGYRPWNDEVYGNYPYFNTTRLDPPPSEAVLNELRVSLPPFTQVGSPGPISVYLRNEASLTSTPGGGMNQHNQGTLLWSGVPSTVNRTLITIPGATVMANLDILSAPSQVRASFMITEANSTANNFTIPATPADDGNSDIAELHYWTLQDTPFSTANIWWEADFTTPPFFTMLFPPQPPDGTPNACKPVFGVL